MADTDRRECRNADDAHRREVGADADLYCVAELLAKRRGGRRSEHDFVRGGDHPTMQQRWYHRAAELHAHQRHIGALDRVSAEVRARPFGDLRPAIEQLMRACKVQVAIPG